MNLKIDKQKLIYHVSVPSFQFYCTFVVNRQRDSGTETGGLRGVKDMHYRHDQRIDRKVTKS